jgi:tripartite-type tricarboxylate transporter receptor subunit TctC
VPTIADTVPGYELSAWFGAGLTGAPPEIIQKLNQEINMRLANRGSRHGLISLAPSRPMTLAEFGKLVADETGKWAKVVKFFGAKAD